jgi:ABC-2 type transport system permease protein
MPAALQKLTIIVPAKYYINILSGLYLRNQALSDLWPDYGVLCLMFLVLGSVNLILLKKEGV